MTLKSLIEFLTKSSINEEIIERIKRKERLSIEGGARLSRAIISSALAKIESRPILIIVPTLEDASRWYSFLQLSGWSKTYLYPSSESSPYDAFDSTREIVWGQLQVLSDLILDNTDNEIAIVATERSLQPHLPSPESFKDECFTIKTGEEIDLGLISNKISRAGYIRTSTVEQEGQWSRRGDIIDIYPVSCELPIRIELFGDEINKIREFDPINQRSLDIINQLAITPCSFESIIANKAKEVKPREINKLLGENAIDQLENEIIPEGIKRILGVLWKETYSLVDYINNNTFVVIDERKRGISHGKEWYSHVEAQFKEFIDRNSISEEECKDFFKNKLHLKTEFCFSKLNKFIGCDTSELFTDSNLKNKLNISSKTIQSHPNQYGKISRLIKDYIGKKVKVWLISAQPSRVVSLLEEHDCSSKFIPNPEDLQSITLLINQNTPIALKTNNNIEMEGVYLPVWNIAIFTDKEFFGQTHYALGTYVRRRRKSASKTFDPNKLVPGDFVVHRNHGIGRFIKLEKISISKEIRDYLVVKYLDGILRVAADQLGSLGRYRSNSEKKPNLNKLGGANWNKVKEKARKTIQKVALDLIKLYAERSQSKGYAYPLDGPWQKELEDSFAYEATEDQLKAVKEIKIDMEKQAPMDRLVCGDVGFGKTEVAIRAIFKAITAGKQIALLTPTTILAQQHWRTISERFAPYPIKVALLNRFRTSTERKEIILQLKEGTIDAVIGTHLLLNKNISFKNLGLLVIDEEQRFGVTQKEKIKVIKKNIDVLTLSATPIPRTLYMSISGVREMSLINTPPPLRQPIKTHLTERDEEVIRSAVCQELDRGGQIFYVVPRVEGINEYADKLKASIPGIKLIIAHGQMPEGELEVAMVSFNLGEADLMLCTTIIESGLDIPRVNTIIIEDAHKFGLSQLYQLRGRVGRSGVQAHAWMFFPEHKLLNDSARQRLRAIQEFSQLGSGYQLAIRDMEIRGVGNLLGMEQSGNMESIGFDLYMEMLQECLAEIDGKNIPNVEETQVDLSVTAFIPSDWIIDNEEKISAYRAITECKDTKSLAELATIWNDRYGNIPKAVESLFKVMRLKLISKSCGLHRIKKEDNNLILETKMDENSFRILRKGLANHLHPRFIYQKSSKKSNHILVRGLGNLNIDEQLTILTEWLSSMKEKMTDLN